MATIDGSGLAHAQEVGSTTIRATYGFGAQIMAATATLDVFYIGKPYLDVSPITSTLAPGGTQQLTATGNYSDGTSHDLTSTATWASSATAVATVDSQGLVTAVSAGTTTITASYQSVTGTAGVTVIDDIDKIQVSPVSIMIAQGATQQLTATATTTSGKSSDVTSQVVWTSSDTAVATVDSLGLVTGLGSGTCDLKATLTVGSKKLSDSTSLTITGSGLTGLQLTGPTAISIDTQYTATAFYYAGATLSVTSSATWISSDPAVADFSTTTPGLLQPKKSGTIAITATYGGVSSTPLMVTVVHP